MPGVDEIYYAAKSDKWIKGFANFCRYALAASFLPTGIVKIFGQRFAEGLPSNNPLGHYFDALLQTGYYYTFIGVMQVIVAILLLVPRTVLLGAVIYFPMIVNICVLTYATRFAGTRANTMLLLGCIFLLLWYYDRLKYILPFKQYMKEQETATIAFGFRHRIVFFSGVFAGLTFIIVGTAYLFEIGPGNSEAECRNQCYGSKNPAACEAFCDCIYNEGQSLDSCLAKFNKDKDIHR
jgi:hypothetical protein